MDEETLEQVFVQRNGLVERIVASVVASVSTGSKHHTLIVGPRGSGKTHLVAVAYNRLARLDPSRARCIIAWLREEEWGISSLLDLQIRILRALERDLHTHEGTSSTIESLYSLPARDAERAAREAIKGLVGKRTLILIAENLDEVFRGLAEKGQRQLRAIIQEDENWSVLATAPTLFPSVSLQTSPFYGFFRVVHLERFDLDDAVDLVAKIAAVEGQSELAGFIRTPAGRSRIRALHHLAGGNPRIYVILSHFLTRQSLDELASLFVRAMDDLTPYYQARMQWLSLQQRKIIDCLVNSRGALAVKDIAKRTFASQQTVSGQLRILKDLAYVSGQTVGRETYYELSEPLMRFALELKSQHTGPIKLLVDFLRIWYSRKELRQRLENLDSTQTLEQRYLHEALNAPEGAQDPRVEACVQAYHQLAAQEDWQKALEVCDELLVTRGETSDWRAQAECLIRLGRLVDALESYDQLLEMDSGGSHDWHRRGWILDQLERSEESLASFERAILLDPNNADNWYWKAAVLRDLNRLTESESAATRSVELNANDPYNWSGKAWTLLAMNRLEDASLAMEEAARLRPTDPRFQTSLAHIHMRASNRTKATNALLRAEATADDADVWYRIAVQHVRLMDYDRARRAAEQAIEMGLENAAKRWNAVQIVVAAFLGRDLVEEAIARLQTLPLISPAELEEVSDLTGLVVAQILERVERGSDAWNFTKRLAESYASREMSLQLFIAVLSFTKTILHRPHIFDTWLALWRQAAAVDPRMLATAELPLRLIDVAKRFHETKDLALVMALPAEERDLLQQLISFEGFKEPDE